MLKLKGKKIFTILRWTFLFIQICGAAPYVWKTLNVGFLLLWYSVVCTVQSFSLIYLPFVSWSICTRRGSVDKLGMRIPRTWWWEVHSMFLCQFFSKSGPYFRQDIFIVICLLTFELRQKYNHFSKSLQWCASLVKIWQLAQEIEFRQNVFKVIWSWWPC